MDAKKTDDQRGPSAVHYYDDGVDFDLGDGRIIRVRESEGLNMYKQISKGIYIDLVMPGGSKMKDIAIKIQDSQTGRDTVSVALTKDTGMALFLMLAHMMDEGFFDEADITIPTTHDKRTKKGA